MWAPTPNHNSSSNLPSKGFEPLTKDSRSNPLTNCTILGPMNAVYYIRFKTRVDVAEPIGVSFNNLVLWEWKSQELYSVSNDLLSDSNKKA